MYLMLCQDRPPLHQFPSREKVSLYAPDGQAGEGAGCNGMPKIRQ